MNKEEQYRIKLTVKNALTELGKEGAACYIIDLGDEVLYYTPTIEKRIIHNELK